MGLIGQHSYALLEVRTVTTESGDENLVKLRNPWGNKEWTGDWSDSSPKWTPALRRELKVSERNDGTFWMSFTDFSHFFSFITVCRINDAFEYRWAKAIHEKGSKTMFKMTVNEPSTQYIGISQQDKRCFDPVSGYDYSHVRMVCGRADNYDYQFGKLSGATKDRNLWEVHEFEPGEYLFHVEFDWCGSSHDYVFSAYGSSGVEIVEVPYEEDFLQNVYKSCAVKNGKQTNYEEQGAPECIKYTDFTTDGYGYCYFVNNSDSVAIKETLTYTKFKGL